jgi:hypothetical protein
MKKVKFMMKFTEFLLKTHLTLTSKPFEWSKGEARFPLGRIVNCVEGFFT